MTPEQREAVEHAATGATQSTEVATRSLDPVDQWLASQDGYDYQVMDDGRKVIAVNDELAKRVNLLCPVSSIVQVDPNWSPQLRFTRLTPHKDTYKVGSKKIGDSYVEVHSLDAPALAKLAQLCGIEHRKTKVQRWDGGMLVEVTARMRGADGLPQYRTRSRDVTFKDWEELLVLEALEKWEKYDGPSSNKAPNKRKPRPTDTELRKMVLTQKNFLQPSLETKAFGRCVKAFLGVSTFLRPQLEKPFMTVGWLMTPNLADPGVKDLIRLNYAESVADLYGPDQEENELRILERGPEREEIEGHLSPEDLLEDGQHLDRETGEVVDGTTSEDPEDWEDDDGDEDEGGDDDPRPAKPEKHFKIPASANNAFAGLDVEKILEQDGGWQFIAAKVKKATGEERRELGLAWLSWKSGNEISIEDLS